VSHAEVASMKLRGAAVLAGLILFTLAGTAAKADPCAIACRSQHNNCRMAAKLLFSPRCDAQLQDCIVRCFAALRFNRLPREDRGRPDFRDRRVPGDMRDPPGMRDGPDVRVAPGLRVVPELRVAPETRGPPPGVPPLERRGFPVEGAQPGTRGPPDIGPRRDFRDFRGDGGPRWLGGPGGGRGRF
jgi:hypothetical protein